MIVNELRLVVQRRRDPEWDFRGQNADAHVHGLHPYPAMMFPGIARKLIGKYMKEKGTILDPFCGSGTVLVEAILQGHSAIGYDINPFALLLARVKTRPIPGEVLRKTAREIEKSITTARFNPSFLDKIDIPPVEHIEFWFKPDVARKLAYLKWVVDQIQDPIVKEFFYVIFARVARETSNTRSGEFKMFRRKNLEKWNPDPFSYFLSRMSDAIKRMDDFYRILESKGIINKLKSGEITIKVEWHDARKPYTVPPVDMIITSPPYGDSKTTVAYGQFSRLALQWLGYPMKEIRKIDGTLSLGGGRKKEISDLPFVSLRETIMKIAKRNARRAQQVLSFFRDMYISVCNLRKVIKDNGIVAFVVGNRTVAKVTVPMDIIISEFFIANGFTHIETIVREIPSKRMPLRTSPSNVPGDTVATMRNEYIVILRKEK